MKPYDVTLLPGTVKRIKRLTVLALWIAAFALSATAGQPQPLGDWTSLSGLAPGSQVRVSLANGKTLRGILQGATTESLTINAATGQESHLRQDVRRVQLRRPGHRVWNAVAGFAIGTGAGLAAGVGVDSVARPDFLLPHAGAMVLTPIGAIAGTVIGVVLPTGGWRDVYRAP